MTVSCADVDPVVAELALDLLPGQERGAALAHVEGCAPCRRRLVELTAAADRLVVLTPAAEPPAGFEQRVLDAIDAEPAPLGARPAPAIADFEARARRSWRMAAAAAVVAVALAGAALAVIAARPDSRQREAAMIAADGAPVGEVYVHDGSPAWLLVSVPAWTDRWGGQRYVVRITAVDGSVTEVAGGDLRAGAGAWGTSLPIAAGDVRTVVLVGDDGRLWCTGSLT